MISADIQSLYIVLYRSYVIEHNNVGEHVGVLSYIELLIDKLSDNGFDVGAFLFTQCLAAIFGEILLVVNEVVWVILVYIHEA